MIAGWDGCSDGALAHADALRYIARRMTDQPDPSALWESIDQQLYAGRKIEAIKLYREATSAGLAEAKSAVEARESELRAAVPERFAQPAGKGCMSVILSRSQMVLAV
jgi:ribosomal protein L7/L12